MNNENKFKGNIYFTNGDHKKKTLVKYDCSKAEVEFHQSMMSSFTNLNFSTEEKQKLSRPLRKHLQNYININVFELNKEAHKLIQAINMSDEKNLKIAASDFGAFICLAALYSGKINHDKKVNFELDKSPVGLFPSTLLKKMPIKNHKVHYHAEEEFWIDDFQTLCEHKKIPLKTKKAA